MAIDSQVSCVLVARLNGKGQANQSPRREFHQSFAPYLLPAPRVPICSSSVRKSTCPRKPHTPEPTALAILTPTILTAAIVTATPPHPAAALAERLDPLTTVPARARSTRVMAGPRAEDTAATATATPGPPGPSPRDLSSSCARMISMRARHFYQRVGQGCVRTLASTTWSAWSLLKPIAIALEKCVRSP